MIKIVLLMMNTTLQPLSTCRWLHTLMNIEMHIGDTLGNLKEQLLKLQPHVTSMNIL